VGAELAISARRLGVKYNLRLTHTRTLRQALSHRLRRRSEPEEREFWALRDVSFDLDQGEILGVIGRNGSGKSTLLLVIAGILQPDAGSISVAGKTSALLTIGAGFEPDLTGRQNIYLNGAYLGLTQKTMRQLEDEIVGFAELGDFIDAPVRTYSAGMRLRLGFAIASHIDPDILLLDEVLGVGDIEFQQKSEAKLQALIERARSIVIVSHTMEFVRKICTKALWLHGGRVRAWGAPDDVIRAYAELFSGEARHATSPLMRAFQGDAPAHRLSRSQ
jgi:ABC-type polysaccharide/polyol phosphate transport system ATPase subunit